MPAVLAVRHASAGNGVGLTCVRLAVRQLAPPYLRPASFPRRVDHVDGSAIRGWADVTTGSPSVISGIKAAEESILELRSSDKLEACDLDDPIGMYTSGLDKVSLDGEGARYFASSTPENCKNGLKLRVHVPQPANDEHTRFAALSAAAAAGPVPAASAHLKAPQILWIAFVIAVAV
ncbi:hypothetical protein B296_00032110 [Ensete ventricosum]|uniref:Phytocyanin domain-containing protein n=1 Tax=Ensete ventricosum TaxID=4639 RepID=A0A426XG73_ENSVE|nr:hypothetical protein B296_00032110 [Ensete ventricosum]